MQRIGENIAVPPPLAETSFAASSVFEPLGIASPAGYRQATPRSFSRASAAGYSGEFNFSGDIGGTTSRPTPAGGGGGSVHFGSGAESTLGASNLQLGAMATSGFGTSSRSPTRFDKTAVTPLSAGWTGGAFTGNTLTVRSQTYHAGWLWKMAAAPPLIKWKKYWCWLAEDRLYYSSDDTDMANGGNGQARYVSLDRVPVRPLPHRTRDNHGPSTEPDIGITLEDASLMRSDTRGFKPLQGCVFSLVVGPHTFFLAAESPESARTWVAALREAWLHAFRHTTRATGVDPSGDFTLLKRAEAEKEELRATLRRSQSPGPGDGPGFKDKYLSEKARAEALEQKLAGPFAEYEIEVKTGNLKGASTDARVYIELLRDNEGSGELRLAHKNNPKRPFARGTVDIFLVKCRDFGMPTSLRVWHDNTGRSPAWFLESIRVRKKGTRRWALFPCASWLSTRIGDRRIERLLQEGIVGTPCEYVITTQTGDLRGAGTDANVYIVLHGTNGDSKRHVLSSGPDDFARGARNQFTVEDSSLLGDVGEVTVGHDGSGSAPAWFLDWLTVTNTRSGQTFAFACGQWFGAGLGDGSIERTLRVSPGGLGAAGAGMLTYRVTVHTSNIQGAGTDADVYVVLRGERGDTPKTVLPSRIESFERGSVDVFSLRLPNVGRLHHLTLGHNNQGAAPAWHCSHVEVVEEGGDGEGRRYFFPVNGWLGVNADADNLLERTVPVSNEDPSLWQTEYKVEVHTGSFPRAGTDARVSVRLIGDRGDSGPQRLQAPREAFEPGRVDAFGLALPFLGPLQRCVVSHDNSGTSPNWYLNKIVVTCKRDGSVAYFPAYRWITSADPKAQPSAELRAAAGDAPVARYKIDVATSDLQGANTDCDVFLELVGDAGSFGPLPMVKTAAFGRGQTDTFVMEGPDVGAMRVARVQAQPVRAGSGNDKWHLSHMLVTKELPAAGNTFGPSSMPSAAPGGGLRTSASLRPAAPSFAAAATAAFVCNAWFDDQHGRMRELPATSPDAITSRTSYTIRTFTANAKNAGTDAAVEINLLGPAGETGFVPLTANYNTFEAGQEDVFTVQAPDVGAPLSHAVLRTDGRTARPAWHVSHVVVEAPQRPPMFFDGDVVLDERNGFVAQLAASAVDPRTVKSNYQLTVHTSDVAGAGTDANVYVDLRGRFGSSGKVVLKNRNFNNFERGQSDKFEVPCHHLGRLTELLVGHDSAGIKPGWHLKHIDVFDPATNQSYYFVCDQWLDRGKGDLKTERLLAASATNPDGSIKQYRIVTHTSNIRGAGTDANVHIILFGADGRDTGRLTLDRRLRNDFEAGKSDDFVVSGRDVGPLRKIRIGHDSSGLGAAWHLAAVDVTDLATGQHYRFIANRWLSKTDGDRQTEVDLYPEGAAGANQVTYNIEVITSNIQGAGTDANVWLQLFGTKDQTPPMQLDDKRNNFERGQHDAFSVKGPDVGEVKKAKLTMDFKGLAAAWHCEMVIVTNTADGRVYYFYVGSWFDKQHGLEKELTPSATDPRQSMKPYMVSTTTGRIRGAGTDSNVFIDIKGQRGSSGPIKLQNPVTPHRNWFEAGQTDTFPVKAVELGPLESLDIWIDGAGLYSDWYLEHVTVQDPYSGAVVTFPCAAWLGTSHGDRTTRRTLRAAGAGGPPVMAKYRVTTVTSSLRGAGTDARVFIQIIGPDGQTERVPLAQPWRNCFESGQTDTFEFEARNVARINRVRIGHDNFGFGADWHLASLVVENLTTGERAEFTVNRWFAKGREDGAIERELTPTAHYLPPGMADAGVGGSCHYSVAIRTQPAQGGLLPDDSEVLVNIIGLGDQATGLHSLALGGTGIAAGALEIFDLEGLPDVGPIRQLDMFATIPNWGVESVEVVNETTGMRAVFLPDGPLQRGNAPIYAAEYVDAPGWAGAAQQQQYGMMTQQFDGSATVERVMGGKSGAPGYTVVFHTSNICWAGTKAKVYFELIGDTGSSGMVFPSTGAGQFERGVSSSGSYARLPFLGDIRQVIVGTDGDGFGAAWHLRQVEVIHSASGMRYLFDCNRWIDKGCAWRRVLQARR